MTITIEEMIDREILCCVSSLISDVLTLAQQADHATLKSTSFDLDELSDLCQQPDYEAAVDNHINDMDRDGLIEALSDAGVEDGRGAEVILAAAVQQAADEGDMNSPNIFLDEWPGFSDRELRAKLKEHLGNEADGYKDFCSERNLDYDYIEVYEHWAVTDWFAGKLRGKGQTVGDFGNLTVWGRTATGQAISMDHVVQEIYKEMIS